LTEALPAAVLRAIALRERSLAAVELAAVGSGEARIASEAIAGHSRTTQSAARVEVSAETIGYCTVRVRNTHPMHRIVRPNSTMESATHPGAMETEMVEEE